jgi:3-oxoacyl-[acyl-carrier protein] reductase
MKELNNILIIGSSGSIGSQLCPELERIGYNCIRTSRNISDNDSEFLDLSDFNSIDALAKNLSELNGIIFLSGREPSENIESMTEEHLDLMINLHFKSVIWVIKKLKDKIINGGFIITTSSVSSHKGSYDPAYSSLKSAIEGLTRTLVKDLSPHIRINSVAPGLIEGSKVFNLMTQDFRERHLETTPLKRFASINDIIETYVFLIKNKHITGQTIHVNGGQYIG